MSIRLYNTLNRKKEEFEPIQEGVLSMYNCGPTVYDRAHIGNIRSYVFADIIRRTFLYAGYQVKQVINITDVGHLTSDADAGEDKMTKALKREGKSLTLESMRDVADKYSQLFLADLKALNVEPAEAYPKASEHIEEDIAIIKKLEEKGFIYKTSDGLYFDTAKFSGYPKLGNIKMNEQKVGERIEGASEKHNPADFSVWKFDSALGWDTPWGKGFPGWHIECSAMSRKYLGQPFDIHTGGIDHIPVHHNNEIAQSEAAYDTPLAHYWLHNEFLTIKDAKMAKSAGTFITLDTLAEKGLSPLSYRYWLLTAHYRSPVDFSYEALDGAQKALIRLLNTVAAYPDGGKVSDAYRQKFQSFVNDDFDTPKAVALVWELLKDNKVSDGDKRATIIDFDKILGLNVAEVKRIPDVALEAPPELTVLAEAREEARKNKDFKKADALREEIENRGYGIRDIEGGFELFER